MGIEPRWVDFSKQKGRRDSLRWIQLLVNDCPESINEPLRKMVHFLPYIQASWLAVVRAGQFTEYGDLAFLDLLGIRSGRCPLGTFRQEQGSQPDALARGDSDKVLLVKSRACKQGAV